jgi:hypothetical protein
MDIHSQIVEKIITEQENVIGPLALELAKRVSGLTIDWPKHEIRFQGDKKQILERLVQEYESLFGATSVNVCKNAIRPLLSEIKKEEIPQILQ